MPVSLFIQFGQYICFTFPDSFILLFSLSYYKTLPLHRETACSGMFRYLPTRGFRGIGKIRFSSLSSRLSFLLNFLKYEHMFIFLYYNAYFFIRQVLEMKKIGDVDFNISPIFFLSVRLDLPAQSASVFNFKLKSLKEYVA